MKRAQVAAQLYTLREFLQTPEEIARTLHRVKALGYDAVQVSGMGPIAETELRKIVDGEGLTICATHENGRRILEEPERVIDRLRQLNCRHTAYPFPHEIPADRAGVIALAVKLDEAARKFEAAGLTLSYHNHDLEFARFEGDLWLDLIYRHAPALRAELDLFWVQAGGGSPERWVEKMAGRQVLIHLKDYGMLLTPERARAMRPVGQGNLDWYRILPAAERSPGLEWYIVEQDVCQKDPFESLKDSLDYLVENFVD